MIPHPASEDVSQVVSDGRRKRRIGSVLWLLGVLFGGVLFGALVASLWSVNSRLSEQDADVGALRSQLIALGVAPDVSTDPAEGRDGTNGVDGQSGQDGVDGEDGEDGRDGLTVVGPAGPAGANGTNGTDGRDGRDGQPGGGGVQGDVGPPGPSGSQGPQGDPGTQGAAGVDGSDGSGVGSFTFVAGGVVYLCADPEGDLAYECSAVMT